ncbi:hypothetical protein [Anaerocolumna jejuensis]|uniref:hypothetical protein n=1 Tax=Anaerocolumna jejuensis TaxID=259063 RepID=UPI001480B03D|nr:hypothetical protein [Anaerocolumna jejuensis]
MMKIPDAVDSKRYQRQSLVLSICIEVPLFLRPEREKLWLLESLAASKPFLHKILMEN